jgi:outer membrane protein assembly factor BamB
MRLASLLVLLTLGLPSLADNWPAWRGRDASGHANEKDLPLTWSATENVKWKARLPGPGNSTPAVWGRKILLTQSLDKAGQRRATLCFDRADGKLLWQRDVDFQGKESTHIDNPYCSASPATDGERAVVSHGSAGVFCYDLDGKELWRRDLGLFEHIWGNAASPVVYRDLVILNCGPGERTFLLAVDKHTGRDVWKVDEPGGMYGHKNSEWIGSWSTPVVATIDGRDELIMTWPEAVKAYDPLTGQLLWTCRGLTRLVYTSPLVTPRAVVAMSGFHGSALAVRPGGRGDVTESHRLWHHPDRAPQRIGSGVILGDHVFIANEPGTLQCIELFTGKTLWVERLGGRSWGNLVHAAGRLYVTNLEGETFVAAARPEFEVLARNPLKERTLASIAPADGEIFIRTYEHLWCIGK